MGHSCGGLVTQFLRDRRLGAAGVAGNSAPVKGIVALPLSMLRFGVPALKNPVNIHRAVALTAEEFHHAFTNTLTTEEAALYARSAVPGPGRVLFQAALANVNPHAATTVDFRDDHALLGRPAAWRRPGDHRPATVAGLGRRAGGARHLLRRGARPGAPDGDRAPDRHRRHSADRRGDPATGGGARGV